MVRNSIPPPPPPRRPQKSEDVSVTPLPPTAEEVELNNIKRAKAETEEQMNAALFNFVQNTLRDLYGHSFATWNDITLQFPALCGNSLAYRRDKMVRTRDAVVASINEQLEETLTVDDIIPAFDAAREAAQKAKQALFKAHTVQDKLMGEMNRWRKSEIFADLALDEQLAKNGKPRLSADTRALYTQKPARRAFGLLAGKETDKDRIAVIKAMNAYGHGKNGKDFFAHVSTLRVRYDEEERTQQSQIIRATQDVEAAASAEQNAITRLAIFESVAEAALRNGGRYITDAEIAQHLQHSLISYCSNPAFLQKTKGQFAEDFPQLFTQMQERLTSLTEAETALLKEHPLAEQPAHTKVGADANLSATEIAARESVTFKMWKDAQRNSKPFP